MGKRYFTITLVFFLGLTSCSTMNSKTSRQDIPLIHRDETISDVQTAVGSLTNAITFQTIRAKYCPVCGTHYGPGVMDCPKDGTKLKEVEE